MKVWDSIESLAEDQGISDRTAWRWLKQGRIKKKRSEGGHMVFVLSGEPTDITDTDVTDMTATDVSDTNGDIESVSNRERLKDRKQSPLRPVSGLVQGLRDELEATRLSFELEKVHAAKDEWQARRDREKTEKAEQERILKLEQFQSQEWERQAAEREAKARAIIQRTKNEVLPIGMKAVIPSHILSFIYMEMEKVLSKMDVLSLPFDELVTLAEGIKNKLVREFSDELRPAFRNYWLKLARKQFNQSMRLRYQAYAEAGGPLSYRDFLFSLVAKRTPEERERFFDVVDLTYKPVSEAELEESKAIAAMMERYSR